jgi:hypothetical protein
MEALGKLVAVRFRDKRLLKGWTSDFHPNRTFFHVEEGADAEPTRVTTENLKAVFFIKTLGRKSGCVDTQIYEERQSTAKKVWIEFSDGEKLAGWSNSYGSRRAGFFVFAADPDSNMEKAYVFRSAIERFEEGDAAEAASQVTASPQDCAWATLEAKISEDESMGSYRFIRKRRGGGKA